MSHLGLVPITLVLLASATFAVSYIIAVVRGDVRAAFPYISDTGSERPESCIFGQFLNFVSFLAFWTMYIRYKAVEAISHMTLNDSRRLYWLNRSSLFVGLISALGTTLVANFQEGTIVEAVHFIGALTAFFAGTLYCFLQTALSYHMCPDYNSLHICRTRLSISVISLVSLVTSIVAAAFAVTEWNSTKHKDSKFKWAPDEPGYAAHIVSTVGEWVTALTFLFFFFTYVKEFDKFNMEVTIRPTMHHLEQVHQRLEVNEGTALLA
ncbi:hypothetical protein BsWGS_07166 [Bradybaena similaris]